MTTTTPKDIAKRLCEAIIHIRRSWIVLDILSDHRPLYVYPSTASDRVYDMLNDHVPIICDTLRGGLTGNVLSGLARICDPAEDGAKRRQLCIERAAIDSRDHRPEAYTELMDAMNRIKQIIPDLPKIRNKFLAHADLEHSMQVEHESSLRHQTMQHVDEQLSRIIRTLESAYAEEWHPDDAILRLEGEVLAAILRNGTARAHP